MVRYKVIPVFVFFSEGFCQPLHAAVVQKSILLY